MVILTVICRPTNWSNCSKVDTEESPALEEPALEEQAAAAMLEEPAHVSALLRFFIAWCLCGVGYGVLLFFHRPDGSFSHAFDIQHLSGLGMAIPGCAFSAAQSARSLRAIGRGAARTLRQTSIALCVHTLVFTITSTVLLAVPFAGYVPVRAASAVHICLQLPFAALVVRGLVRYRRYLLSAEGVKAADTPAVAVEPGGSIVHSCASSRATVGSVTA